MDEVTEKAIKEVVDRYDPHTVIVYGSRARGDATNESDVDMACFLDAPSVTEDFRNFDGIFLDAWIYPTKSMKNTDDFVQMGKAFCAVDKFGYGELLLQKIEDRIEAGPIPLTNKQKRNIIELRIKNLKRISNNDVEGNHRRAYLQYTLLETYFILRDKWFFGAKSSLSWLQENDQVAFALFEKVYQAPQDYDALKKLTLYTTNIEYAHSKM
ncbi:nucleotidyltransferase domain-containing protein [Agarivorans sp. 1_MG-2023]|uniref:nucleotidyltransferase domain-containing protein n=1 Tax=Agarivorans sp. 1_MG-2023 TaxID=3062634 RepID=UPI0026E20184|nr:nucleotidyltransferase domain-containing protein [Agarivorans sp. 1_MG-2023]MDO6762932.1 nucleotidyltransferase domain-containing protein [Agarivorans sp. 1_MG-2023]